MISKYLSLATIFLLANSLAFADSIPTEEEPSKIEIVGQEIDATKTTADAKGDVLVYYGSTILRSDKAFFDKNSSLLTLDGNIDSIGYEQTKEQSDHIVINTKTKNVNFDKLFLTDESDIWLYTDDAVKNAEIYNLGNTIVSSCSVKNPLWKMVFNKSSYDKNENYMKVYGAKLYMWDTPVMYLPYVAFNTKRERRSGLLFPKIGYSNNDGFVYEQPIFLAFSDSWDLEINPQMRTNRTNGLYGTLRFADTQNSHGEIRGGLFSDYDSYTKSTNNRYSNHYGLEFLYDSSRIFDSLPFEMKDGLYTNLIYLNDIDYINLQKSKLGHFGSGYFQESRINYFASNNDYYAGLNAKYFIDTTAISNSNTLQVLPSLNLHKYYSSFAENFPFNYSLDLKATNYTRGSGANFRRLEMLAPIEYNANFFNDYIKLTLSEELYATKLLFNGTTNLDTDFSYVAPLQTIKLYSDLTKKYENGIHLMQPYARYVYPSEVQTGNKLYANLGSDTKELFQIDLTNERLELGGSQYFYYTDSDMKFYQRFLQPYYTKLKYNVGDFSHEFGLSNKNFDLSNKILYSHEFGKLRSAYSAFSIRDDVYSGTISHSYNTTFIDEVTTTTAANDINFDASYKSSDLMRWYGGISYNIKDSYSTAYRIGGDYQTDCFGLDIFLRKSTIPSLGASGASYNSSTDIYFQISFKPFASTGS